MFCVRVPMKENAFVISMIVAPNIECDNYDKLNIDEFGISIHAPNIGCDPMRPLSRVQQDMISIHAPNIGCDSTCSSYCLTSSYFNPRTQYRVRQLDIVL